MPREIPKKFVEDLTEDTSDHGPNIHKDYKKLVKERNEIARLLKGAVAEMNELEHRNKELEENLKTKGENAPVSKKRKLSAAPSIKEDHCHRMQPIVEEDGKKKFKLSFDVSHFLAQDIVVETSQGKLLIVRAKHQTKTEGGESKCEYLREHLIPEGVNLKEMTFKYSDEGVLVVEAPYSLPVKEPKEEVIVIKHG